MKKTTTFRLESPDFRTTITVRELSEFLAEIAGTHPDAEVEPVLGDRGGQRDPIPFLRGVVVTIQGDDGGEG